MLKFCDFIQVFVFTTNQHLKRQENYSELVYSFFHIGVPLVEVGIC